MEKKQPRVLRRCVPQDDITMKGLQQFQMRLPWDMDRHSTPAAVSDVGWNGMRRALGGFLILLYCVGPFVTVLPANAESRLPACCRRHGAHHCNMSSDEMGTVRGFPALQAPSHCPLFPHGATAPSAPVHAEMAGGMGLPVLLAEPHSAAAARAAALVSQIRTRSGRAPPAPNLL